MLSYRDTTASTERELWTSLQLYSIYRFILAATCLILAYQNAISAVFAQEISALFVQNNTDLFLHTSLSYLLFAVFMLILGMLQKPNYQIQANASLYSDIVFLLIMLHACGGILSGMGLLLIVVAAAHSILSPGKLSLLSAAMISIGLLTEYFYSAILQDNLFYALRQVGLLGLITFITSIIVNFLAFKALKRQSIIHQQSAQLATSFQLNAIIVNSMQQGVMVLDEKNTIKLMNSATLNLLGFDAQTKVKHFIDLPLCLQHCILNWIKDKKNLSPLEIPRLSTKIRLEITELGSANTSGLLIFLYDIKAEIQHVQDLKLRSLGHLTANIAHEIRNPLSSASHAAQLLQESLSLTEEDLILTKMIHSNCNRMNQVIKNVLSLTCQQSTPQMIELNQWINESLVYLKFPQHPNAAIHFNPASQPIWISIDPGHLTQIIVNLCENGLRFSAEKSGAAIVTLQIKSEKQLNQAYLDIIDEGNGIPEQIQEFIYEPFFTTGKTGTGLGLYLARELSQINGAYLNYQNGALGSQFRITFVQESVE